MTATYMVKIFANYMKWVFLIEHYTKIAPTKTSTSFYIKSMNGLVNNKDMTKEEIFDKTLATVLENERKGKVTYMTGMGLMTSTLESFCRQDADGVLYDLNRDRATTITLGRNGGGRWINDYAVAMVIEYLMKEIERLKNEKS